MRRFRRHATDAAGQIGPERVEEDELGVNGLPEEEIGQPLLAGRSTPQVYIGNIRLVEVTMKKFLVDLVRAELPAATSQAIAAMASRFWRGRRCCSRTAA